MLSALEVQQQRQSERISEQNKDLMSNIMSPHLATTAASFSEATLPVDRTCVRRSNRTKIHIHPHDPEIANLHCGLCSVRPLRSASNASNTSNAELARTCASLAVLLAKLDAKVDAISERLVSQPTPTAGSAPPEIEATRVRVVS